VNQADRHLNDYPHLMTLAEAARTCNHAAVTLRQAAQRGALRTTRVGEGNRSTLYVSEADLQTYLAGRKTWQVYGAAAVEKAR